MIIRCEFDGNEQWAPAEMCVHAAEFVITQKDRCHPDAEDVQTCAEHLAGFIHRGADCTGSNVFVLR